MRKKLRIAFFELEDWQKAYFETQLREHSLVFIDEPLGGGNARRADECDALAVFVMSEVKRKALALLPNLKFVATMSTGYDHVDLKECARRGIAVSNVPTYGENTVAEHAFALILALSRKIFESVEQTRRGDFSTRGLRGFDLKGRTLGIVGTGHIGLHVARVARGFEMNVLASDVRPDRKMAKRFGFKYVPFDYLLKNSDIVTLHVPTMPSVLPFKSKPRSPLVEKSPLRVCSTDSKILRERARMSANACSATVFSP